MTLAGVVATHPWLDSRMRIVGYDPIQSEHAWRSSGLLLGQAVHEVVKQLQLYPPAIVEITDKGLLAIQAKHSNNNNNNNNTINSQQKNMTSSSASSQLNGRQPNRTTYETATAATMQTSEAPPGYHVVQQQLKDEIPAPDVALPEIPTHFHELELLGREDLEKLLEDELEFMTFVHKLPTCN